MTLTHSATDVIRDLVESSQLPETGGLRMELSDPDMNGSERGLAVSLAEQPAPDDEVLDEDGVHVFLTPQVASLLGDKELDATVDEGKVTFLLHEQA
ncbi:MAG: Fe-S cluster assembly protein HesB [Gaiellales bacterium]